ncbi:c-type cytochrome [Phaeovulum sp.]|uniref:c-type cytochrome n=1 Tax=Phaeovulum sp. TaxID=2934796 RepID=UPI002731BE09|nr:cytochrome c [Phaeovulum sp.]MDP1668810.1 cytochrome c [Phaeovulum sp.]MDZ4119337.1 cytochrome c [Phaeovulum sp.]
MFEENCQVCHGANGVGEAPGDPEARDEFGFKAPALNDDAHAWHHSDQTLICFIAEGSPCNTRMVAFKKILSPDDIANLVAYLKSRWSVSSLACQGGRHMGFMAMQ